MFNLEYIRCAERFFALQLPIYYYVKTKGSLASQGLSISKTVKMKLSVFEYYQRFYKTVLDEEEYQRSRPKVYRFLVDAAGDGVVPPAGLPNSKKLGEERSRAAQELSEGIGPLHCAYRSRKLLERHLETAALKHDLSLQDMLLLLALREMQGPCTRRALAELTGLSRGTLSLSLQRLAFQELILPETQKDPEERLLRCTFLPKAEVVFQDLDLALEDARQASQASLTPEEQAQYESLSARVWAQTQTALR